MEDNAFPIASSPKELDARVRERKGPAGTGARLVAGYCWDWASKRDPAAMDIVFPAHNFAWQWNLSEDGGLWIVRPSSIDQIGCIHTCQSLEFDYVGVIIGPTSAFRRVTILTAWIDLLS